jgi:hypothetical protein
MYRSRNGNPHALAYAILETSPPRKGIMVVKERSAFGTGHMLFRVTSVLGKFFAAPQIHANAGAKDGANEAGHHAIIPTPTDRPTRIKDRRSPPRNIGSITWDFYQNLSKSFSDRSPIDPSAPDTGNRHSLRKGVPVLSALNIKC